MKNGWDYYFSGRLHLPYTDPLPSPFNATISSFRHIQYLQMLYLSKQQFFYSVVAFIVSYKCSKSIIPWQTAKFLVNSLTFHSKQNSPTFTIFHKVGTLWSHTVNVFLTSLLTDTQQKWWLQWPVKKQTNCDLITGNNGYNYIIINYYDYNDNSTSLLRPDSLLGASWGPYPGLTPSQD